MDATRVTDKIQIIRVDEMPGETCILTECHDYETYAALPSLVEYQGRLFGKTGWTSDYGYACFKTGVRVARVIADHKGRRV